MRKIILSVLWSVFLISSVLAVDSYKNYNIKVVQKDPTDWSTVTGGSGNVLLSHGVRNQNVEFRGHAILLGMEPFTSYTLIYYGDKTHNDIWPYATCISSGVTNKHGNVKINEGLFDYSSFIDDGINQKFWIILSSDINCTAKKMIAWNPNSILFEQKVI